MLIYLDHGMQGAAAESPSEPALADCDPADADLRLPSTPPRPESHRRGRENGQTPQSTERRPSKRRESEAAAAQCPAARHALSLPAAPDAAESSDPGRFSGYCMRVLISWRVPDNERGVQSTTVAIGYYLRKFAKRHDLGCSIESRPVANGLEIFIDGIIGQVVVGKAAIALRKKVRNALECVGRRKRSRIVAQCKFTPHVSPPLARADIEVLDRIQGRALPRSGFQSWWKFPPKPPAEPAAAAPAPVALQVPAAVSVAPDAVAMALAADLVNLRSEYQGALGANDFANGFDKAMGLLAIVHSFLQGPRAAAAVEVEAEPVAGGLAIAAGLSPPGPKALAAGAEQISNGAAVPAPRSNASAEGAAAFVDAETEAARGGAPRVYVHP